MPVHSRSDATSELPSRPQVSVYESCPGRVVFIEDGNTDGWIASDNVRDIRA